MRVNADWKPEIAWQIAADLIPRSACVIAAHDIPLLLHTQLVRVRWVHGDAVNAMTDLCVRFRNVLRVHPAIDWWPCFPATVRANRSRRGDRDEYPVRIFRVEKNSVQTHAARAGLPLRPGIAAAQACQFTPRFAAVL